MLPFAPPERLVARALSSAYARCVRIDSSAPIDVELARSQHDRYVEALRALDFVVEVLPAEDALADACFVEDTAVMLGDRAMATNPGATSRRPEVASVAAALARDREVVQMHTPATLDGGDVMRVRDTLYVGLSTRTNRAGVEALSSAAQRDGLRVVTLPVRDGLHLKSAMTLATESAVVVDARILGADERAVLESEGLECWIVDEPAGANVLFLGRALLASSAAPKTIAMLRARGLQVRVVDVGEIHKGDGALTCLSLRVPRAGTWCT